MIKICDNINDIAKLWSEAFGDNFEDIKFFYDNIRHGKCYAYYDDGNIASMLYLIDCTLNGRQSHYVYATCTLNEYRSRGYMSKLLQFISDEYDSVCLIPANENLIEFYSNRNIKYKNSLDDISFDECEKLINDYLFEGCTLGEPLILCSDK